jgi:hypothetical protein
MAEHPWGDPQGPEDTAYDAFGRPYSKKGYEARERGLQPGTADRNVEEVDAGETMPTGRTAEEPRSGRAGYVAAGAGVLTYFISSYAAHLGTGMSVALGAVVGLVTYRLLSRR